MKDESLFWDKTAQKYAKKPVPSEEIYQKKLQLTRDLLTKDMNVLEIGCGTGTTSIIHAPHVRKITATDFSSEMIKIATNKASSKNIDNIFFKQESTHEMNYPKNHFNIIMAHSILHLVENRKEVLEKIYSSLKPGGYFITTTGCIGGLFKIFKPLWYIGFTLDKLPYIGFFTKQDFLSQVKDCGFSIKEQWAPTKFDIFIIAKKED